MAALGWSPNQHIFSEEPKQESRKEKDILWSKVIEAIKIHLPDYSIPDISLTQLKCWLLARSQYTSPMIDLWDEAEIMRNWNEKMYFLVCSAFVFISRDEATYSYKKKHNWTVSNEILHTALLYNVGLVKLLQEICEKYKWKQSNYVLFTIEGLQAADH